MSRCANVLCWLIPAGLCLLANVCAAQAPVVDDPLGRTAAQPSEQRQPETKPGLATESAAGPREPAELEVYDLRYLEGPDGKPVLIPDKVQLQEYLTWRLQREGRDREGPPGVSVASLEFDGTAEDERVLLTARVELKVSTDNAWVRVPLEMREATLRAPAVYTGDGLAVPVYRPKEGYSWWIKGREGKHQLVLSLSLPLRKQATQRRVQLSLPTTAASKLTLRVPAARVSAKAPERSTLSTKSMGQESVIELIGLGNSLDLTWQSLPELNGAATALDVTTSVVATLSDGETATLEATQLIQSLGQQGTFDEVRVALPAGYKLERLEGPDLRDQKTDPTHPQTVVVQFKKATAGPVELKWMLRSTPGTLPAVGEPFALEGFDVERAGWQRGYLAVVIVGEFRIVRLPDEDKFLQRVDQTDLPGALRQTQASTAYRFLNRLLLRMKLQHIDPYLTVDPAIVLHVSSDALELEAAYNVQVKRGSIGSFRLRWPHWKEQGWTTEAELPGHIDLRLNGEAGDPDVIRLEFAEPVKTHVNLRIRARRPVNNGIEQTPLTLPVPEGYGRFPVATPLAVVSADNVEADLRAAETTKLRPVAIPDPRIVVPREWQPLRRTDYRLDSSQTDLTLALAVHPRRIQGMTTVGASISSNAVTVRQTIVLEVAYERISQLRFAIPAGVPAEQLKFFAIDQQELPVTVSPATGRSPPEIRMPLEPPAIGRIEIEVHYALDRTTAQPDLRETIFQIPLVECHDVVFSATRFSCRDAAGRDVAVEGEGWLRQLSPEGLPEWVLSQACRQVTIKAGHPKGEPRGALVMKTLIRTRISPEGTIQSRAQYELAEGISELSVAFGPQIEAVAFLWNNSDRKLHVETAASAPDGTTNYNLILNASGRGGAHLLTIDYLAKSTSMPRLSAGYVLEAPRLSEEQSAAQVRWEIDLPVQQHLFTEPSGFAPDYHWRSGNWFWSREPDFTVAEMDEWIGAAAGPDFPPGPAGGNRYVFSAFGPPPRLIFRAMSQGGIVLISAGTALSLGWVLLYWPRMRHVLTFLMVAFVVALLAVWFAAPVQVLMQPAGVGVGLAVLAAAIQGFLKRRSRPVTVTLNPASGFMTPASSHVRSPAAAVGSDDFTSLRTPPDAAHAAAQLSESGNRT